MDRSLADQMVRDFENNRGDIAIAEEVQALAQERLAVIPVFVVEGLLKTLRSNSISGSSPVSTSPRLPGSPRKRFVEMSIPTMDLNGDSQSVNGSVLNKLLLKKKIVGISTHHLVAHPQRQ